jgi:uncharacterized protein (TIGR02646 family)
MPKPAVLADNETAWTEQYLAAPIPERKSRERWRHAEIKAVLRQELGGRCAYCEGFVDDVSFPHVEHIAPKSIFPERAHIWINLTSACGRCNTLKGDYWNVDLSILDPYADDVGGALVFLGGFVDWRSSSAKGEVSVRRLQLNRIDLVQSRVRRLESIRGLVNEWEKAQGAKREILEDAIRLDMAEGEFAATVAGYLEQRGFAVGQV